MASKKDSHELPLLGLGVVLILAAIFNWPAWIVLIAALVAICFA